MHSCLNLINEEIDEKVANLSILQDLLFPLTNACRGVILFISLKRTLLLLDGVNELTLTETEIDYSCGYVEKQLWLRRLLTQLIYVYKNCYILVSDTCKFISVKKLTKTVI